MDIADKLENDLERSLFLAYQMHVIYGLSITFCFLKRFWTITADIKANTNNCFDEMVYALLR